MNLNINIKTDQYCNIIIKDNSEYQNENTNTINPTKLKFSDTVSIISITHFDIRQDSLQYIHVDRHNKTSFKVPINFDGIFNVNYIVIPTKKWYENTLKRISKETLIQNFGGKLYIYDNDYIIEIKSTGEITESLLNFVKNGYSDNLSVSSYSSDTMLSICKLRKCYINLCQQIFESKNFSPCWNKNKVDSELIYKRDLVWMAINVITYLWKLGNNSEEIKRILNQLNNCNGLCESYPNNSKLESNGCGCS